MNSSAHSGRIYTAHSCALDPRQAVQEFHAAVFQPGMALVVFFCSSHYDLQVLAEEINSRFAGVPVIGCTTAGEIGPLGYRKGGISGASFPAGDCAATVGRLDGLDAFEPAEAKSLVSRLITRLDQQHIDSSPTNRFAFQLIDGLSNREEVVSHALQQELGSIALFGGSAGDDLEIEHTWIFCEGAFCTGAAVLAVVDTVYPITLFKTQNFIGEQERLVVTEADPSRRLIKEINGLPAAQEYARVSGITLDQLDAEHFSASPVVVRINGMDYVRSIQKSNPDGSLAFYCAIERGMILRIAHSIDFSDNLRSVFEDIQAKVGLPQLAIACDCIFRQMEMSNKGLEGAVESLFEHNNVVGFSTYGEQFMGIHMNQTLTGLAIGYARSELDA